MEFCSHVARNKIVLKRKKQFFWDDITTDKLLLNFTKQ